MKKSEENWVRITLDGRFDDDTVWIDPSSGGVGIKKLDGETGITTSYDLNPDAKLATARSRLKRSRRKFAEAIADYVEMVGEESAKAAAREAKEPPDSIEELADMLVKAFKESKVKGDE